MRGLAERSYFLLSLALGQLLRAGRYSKVRVAHRDGEAAIRKRRLFYAPLLVALGGPLVRVLNTGVRVLPQRDWEEREKELYQKLYNSSVRADENGSLILPPLRGETLAKTLERHDLDVSSKGRAIEIAVSALREFHGAGFTHGDAMADNVMVDLAGGVANWFDFETVHEPSRPMVWRRADDVRALIATCVLRTDFDDIHRTIWSIVHVYADTAVAAILPEFFTPILQRPLAFHLGQAGMRFESFREISRVLSAFEKR